MLLGLGLGLALLPSTDAPAAVFNGFAGRPRGGRISGVGGVWCGVEWRLKRRRFIGAFPDYSGAASAFLSLSQIIHRRSHFFRGIAAAIDCQFRSRSRSTALFFFAHNQNVEAVSAGFLTDTSHAPVSLAPSGVRGVHRRLSVLLDRCPLPPVHPFARFPEFGRFSNPPRRDSSPHRRSFAWASQRGFNTFGDGQPGVRWLKQDCSATSSCCWPLSTSSRFGTSACRAIRR